MSHLVFSSIGRLFRIVSKPAFFFFTGMAICVSSLQAQESESPLAKLGWVTEGKVELGSWATIEIPEGFGFLDGDDTRKLMTMMGNLETDREVGMLMNMEEEWFVVYEFDEVGYVKDDEKDELDADKLLKQKKEGQEAANEYREQNGMEPMYVTGWIKEPFYNEETNNLEWGLRVKSASGESANYLTKLLGRKGVMDATLVCNPADMDRILPKFRNQLAGYEYVDGEKYAEYQDGDKIAKYGLTALVVGAGATMAAKAGLFAVIGKFLAKAWKLVVVAVIGVFAAFKRLFGGGR